MGELLSGSTKTTTKTEPWKPQGDALKGIFSSAGDIYNNQKGTPYYQGDLYAGLSPETQALLGKTQSFANSQGQQNANTVTNAGHQMLAQSGVGSGALNQLSINGSTDPTQANITAATAYANNPATNGMVDAASRDVVRNLQENELPGVDRGASASGNINSSRAGVASAIAQRGAADRVADISSTIRGNQFNQGLQLAENARQSNNNTLGNVAQLGNQGYGLGLEGILQGNNLNISNLNSGISAGQIDQQDRQGQNEADFARWQGQDTRESDLLNRYYGIIGANNWGGTQTQKQKTGGNILGQLAGIGMSAAGLGAFGGGGIGK